MKRAGRAKGMPKEELSMKEPKKAPAAVPATQAS